ncbi:tetratricopeptide repeat protein [Shimazuella sp. AN120528]|uniref:tetratricopeptide repeat protein n=1 Tax=Shimazuella soli TaxID=1892854 RepID=UPI001F0EE561|nr:tetratricopeptide repeat protein [Shimazuella soli]
MNIRVSKEKMGEIFRSRRKELGLRQEDVAIKAGVSISTVSNLELGNHTVKEESIAACAEVLGVAEDIYGLLSEAEQKEQWAKRELEKIEKITHANPDEALNQLTLLNEIYNVEASKTLLPLANYLWGKSYFEKRKWPQAEKFLLEAVNLIKEYSEQNEELRDSNILATCYNDLATIYYFQNNLKQALQYVEKGLQVFKINGARVFQRFFLLLNKCLYLQKMNDKEKAFGALEQLQKYVTEAEKTGDIFQNVRLAVIIQYHDIHANVLNDMGMTEKAQKHAQKGIDIAWLNREYDKLLTLWTTMGTIFFNKGNISIAEEYFLQALHTELKVSRKHLLTPAHINLGRLYLQQNQPEIAEKHIKKALSISNKHNNIIQQVEALHVLGDCYLAQQQYDEAITQFELGSQLANQHSFFHKELDLLDTMCNIYEKQGYKDRFISCIEKAYRIRIKLKQREEC